MLYSDSLSDICSHVNMPKYCTKWDHPDDAIESDPPRIYVTVRENSFMSFAVWVSGYPRTNVYKD